MKNNLPVAALSEFVNEVRSTPGEARATYAVTGVWRTGTRLDVSTGSMSIGGRCVPRTFSWTVDEPRQLLGSNHGPNPQELLLSGLAGCLAVAFVAGATARGVQIASLEIEVSAELDLQGFMGLDGQSATGFPEIAYQLRVDADASAEVLESLHRDAVAHSPNAQTIANPVALRGELEVVSQGSDGV
jgi:uncharacterized OsmC-like protein